MLQTRAALKLAGVLAGAGLIALATAAVGARVQEAPPAAPPRPPNIVLIVADDMEAALLAHTPRIRERLASQGLRFDNAFVSQPLCGPSRASILTGLYSHNHQVVENLSYEAFRASGLESSSLATWLQAAGYRTALIGKYLNDYPAGEDGYVPPGWTDWQGLLLDRPAGYFNYSINDNGRLVSYGHDPDDYQTDVLARRAVAFVERASEAGAPPFFLYLAVAPPHAPPIPAPRHRSTPTDASAPRTPSFNEADVEDKPPWVRRLPLLDAGDIARIDRRYARRLRTLLALDEAVEGLLEALERTGAAPNTYVFLTSDNGLLQGQHRYFEEKDLPYEEAIRVPLLVRGPGVAAGEARDELVLNIDLAPTLAEIAGASPAHAVDGRSLVPLLAGPAAPASWRQDFLLEGPAEVGIPPFFGLRTLEHSYVRYRTPDGVEEELYDLRRDPHQLESLDPRRHVELVGRLSARLAELAACRGESCR